MNTKLYWLFRDLWNKITFTFKKGRFSLSLSRNNTKKTRNVSFYVYKTIALQMIKAGLLCLLVLFSDRWLMCMTKLESFDHQVFLDIVIGGIGVAGVILGLYCSNITSMFSSKYTNAPESISNLYQRDNITNKCVQQLVGYITFCVFLLAVCIVQIAFSYITAIVLLLLTIRTIITFSFYAH